MMNETEKVREISKKVGLSEANLSVYASMCSKTPIKISNLFRVVCPNREGIRSLSQEKIRAFESTHNNNAASDSDITKKSKKSSDDWRRQIVKEREKELIANGIKVGGTTDLKKKIPPRQKELQLIWEFLGWGQTSANFYVYVYYIGPENKGEDFIELSRPENWHVVPESHLVLFHKNMGDPHNYFQQTPLSIKESEEGSAHIEYDVRYILVKWKSCQKLARKDDIALVNANIKLFEHKDTLRVKNDKKRSLSSMNDEDDEEEEETKKEKRKSKKSKKSKRVKLEHNNNNNNNNVVVKEYEIKNEKYRRVIVDEYLDVTRYPLCSGDTISFNVQSVDTLLNNAVTEKSRKPASYKWDPTEMIVKPWMIATSIVRLRKQIVQIILKKYNLCFESSDFEAIRYFIMHNKEAADDIKRYCDMFTWSYSVFNVLTMHGFIPDDIDKALTTQ